jgi:predicted lipoprotein
MTRMLPLRSLAHVLACLLVPLASACSERAPTRALVLHNIVETSVVPDARALLTSHEALRASVADLERTPDLAQLQRLRQAWKRAVCAWQRVQTLQLGPAASAHAVMRSMFWPTRISALEALLDDDTPVSDDSIEALGVDVRGMFALEWLLFGPHSSRLYAQTPEGRRARDLASALTHNSQLYVEAATTQLGTGSALQESLARDELLSVSRLVQLSAAQVEQLASDRVGAVLEQRGGTGELDLRELRGGLSGVASELVETELATLQRMYNGSHEEPGLSALVRTSAPAIDEHMHALLQTANARVAELEASLDVVAVRDRPRVVAAHAALKELERALKSELPSALGLTLTFDASDGD